MITRADRSVLGFIIVWMALVVASAHGQLPGGSPEGKKMSNQVKSSPDSITRGGQLFQKYCAFCHGKGALGDGPLAPKGTTPANLTDATWDRGSTDSEIFAVLRDGAGPKFDMKGFKGKLKDEDMWHLVNYLRSLSAAGKSR